jgi:ribosomal protein L32
MAPWHLVHADTIAVRFEAGCASWHVTHAFFPSCFTVMSAWQPVQEAAAEARMCSSCGAWQLVHSACFGSVEASVGLSPWQPTHVALPVATKSCGVWQLAHGV